MKKIITNKIVLALAVMVFAFASAQNSVSVAFTGQSIMDKLLNKSSSASFTPKGIDTLDITFKAVVDNVTATLVLSGSDLAYDSASINVADLFDGLLSVKFFHIGYGAGNNQVARPDIGTRGIKFTIKPIDMLSIALGYGIENREFKTRVGVTNNSDGIMAGYVSHGNKNYHAVQLDVGINNAFVPLTIYGGAVIIDGAENSGINQASEAGGETKPLRIYHASAGLSADLLAALAAGALKVDLGVALPMAGAATSSEYKNELNLAAVVYGSVADLGVEGLGLAYAVTYALDTETKTITMGDWDGVTTDSDSFREMVKVVLTPSYTIGAFKIALEGVFGMIGEKVAMVEGMAEAYNRYEATPSLTWNLAGGNSVKGYATYYDPNMTVDEDTSLKVGLDYNISIGVSQ